MGRMNLFLTVENYFLNLFHLLMNSGGAKRVSRDTECVVKNVDFINKNIIICTHT